MGEGQMKCHGHLYISTIKSLLDSTLTLLAHCDSRVLLISHLTSRPSYLPLFLNPAYRIYLPLVHIHVRSPCLSFLNHMPMLPWVHHIYFSHSHCWEYALSS